jgi:hypothetical protein
MSRLSRRNFSRTKHVAKLRVAKLSNWLKEHHHALALIGKPKRAAKKQSTSTILPPILLNGFVNLVQRVVIVPIPLLGKIFDQSLDGGKFQERF